MTVRMWEARAADGAGDELARWAMRQGLRRIRALPGCLGAEAYRSVDRLVLVTRWEETPAPLPTPPSNLLARPAHEWDFEHLESED